MEDNGDIYEAPTREWLGSDQVTGQSLSPSVSHSASSKGLEVLGGRKRHSRGRGLCKVQKTEHAWEPELRPLHPSSLISSDPEASRCATDGPNQSMMPNTEHYQGLESPKRQTVGLIWERISKMG